MSSSKEVATRSTGGYLANNDDFYSALAAEAKTLKGGGDGKAFMKFDGNTGEFSYGADDVELDLGTRMAINPRSYSRGWVIWVDGEVVYENMTTLEEGQPISKAALPDHGPYGEDDGPVEQYNIDFRLIEDPFVEMVFQGNNSSKRRALAALLKDFANTFRAHPGEVPIIELDEREFEAKTKGGKGRKVTKHAPSFKIVDWMLEEDLLALTEGSREDYQDEAPKRVADKRAPKDDEDERPARRSRRDEPEDEPAPRSRARREEPEDEPAPRRSRRDEPAEDEAPARRSRRDEPEEDEAPARRSRREEPEPEDEPAPARRTRREEPVDDEPEAEERPARRARADADEAPAERPRVVAASKRA